MGAEKFQVLMAIARAGGLHNSIRITTRALAGSIGLSQQSASRWLSKLEAEGMVERGFGRVGLSENGKIYLEAVRDEMGRLFENSKQRRVINGRVVSGMREGRFYLSIPEYKRQIASALGFDVFPGTLNLRLEALRDVDGKRVLLSLPGIPILGFRKNGRQLGGAKLFKAKIIARGRSMEGAAIIPFKSHYGSEILELISPENLRKKMHLNNGDGVEVAIE